MKRILGWGPGEMDFLRSVGLIKTPATTTQAHSAPIQHPGSIPPPGAGFTQQQFGSQPSFQPAPQQMAPSNFYGQQAPPPPQQYMQAPMQVMQSEPQQQYMQAPPQQQFMQAPPWDQYMAPQQQFMAPQQQFMAPQQHSIPPLPQPMQARLPDPSHALG